MKFFISRRDEFQLQLKKMFIWKGKAFCLSREKWTLLTDMCLEWLSNNNVCTLPIQSTEGILVNLQEQQNIHLILYSFLQKKNYKDYSRVNTIVGL